MSERQRHIKVDTTEDASSPHLDAEKIGKFANGELAVTVLGPADADALQRELMQ